LTLHGTPLEVGPRLLHFGRGEARQDPRRRWMQKSRLEKGFIWKSAHELLRGQHRALYLCIVRRKVRRA